MKHLNNERSNRQSWPIKVLAVAVAIGITATVAQTTNATTTVNRKPIGDLEIYAPAKPGTATIFMMLDTSGSMDRRSVGDDYGSHFPYGCVENIVPLEEVRLVIYKRQRDAKGALVINDEGKTIKLPDIQKTISFSPKACTAKGETRYSRMTRLQLALVELLADDVFYKTNNNLKDTGSLADEYEIGLGNFSPSSSKQIGAVLVPTKALTAEQRIKLIEEIKDLEAVSWTPTAHALAESGAYMMGTTTNSPNKVVGYRYFDNRNRPIYQQCRSNQNYLSYDSDIKSEVYACTRWYSGSYSESTLPNYDWMANNYYYSGNEDSGFSDSTDDAKTEDKSSYVSPLNAKECSGNGIYLLTDGAPNKSSNTQAKKVMNTSLSYSKDLEVNTCNSLTGGNSDGAWGCMAEYAALLRNSANNPLGLPIKTATVGFGKDFEGLVGKRTISINGKDKEVVDCNSGNADSNTRNLCKLGERKGDNERKTFGDGGFYYTEESSEIAASIVDFASGLVDIINTAPSGTITIPEDPYRAANQLPYAYLPMLDPDINSAATTWRGNLKKYALSQGTLFGNNDKLLYKDVVGNLEEKTQDLWQTSDFVSEGKVNNNNIAAGGVYAQLKTPGSGLSSVRTIYVEDDTSTTDKRPVLRKLSVNGSGKPIGFDKLVDTTAYSQLNQRRLLSFLGFESVLTNDGQPTKPYNDVKSLTLTKPTKDTKVLGGVVHSKPEAVSYSSVLDANGRTTDDRDDYVLFGSMDGALHLVDADDGKEEVAIIPKSMMLSQPTALVNGSIKDRFGEPYFGVDAPWLVTTDYKYDLEAVAPADKTVRVDTATGKGMFAYGGLRMGGEAFYGMDISNKSAPKMLFTITPTGLSSSTNAKSSTAGFARLGQTWSKPTAAKIRLKKGSDPTKNTEPTDVLIFGGGYDMGYEDENYAPSTAAPARGNAIYMIDAKTGELIWSTSSESTFGKNIKTPTMVNSITGGITVLDRDNDGLIDHIYAADLGGQVFRADFENARVASFGFAAVDSFSNKGVTRILNTAPAAATNKKYAYRFYERPVVSFYRREGGPDNGKLFAMVNVISGNRSAPLSKLRNGSTYANRVYGIIDSDVTRTTITTDVVDLTESDLVNLSNALGTAPSEADKDAAKAEMIAGTKHGWYYPLTRFDGYSNVRHNKGVGDSVVINNLLYTTVYNPDKTFGSVASCAAKIMGGSERQVYCLPYGVCMDDTSITGTGGYVPAGQGIQELTLGAYDKDNTDVKVLIGTSTITERVKEANRAGYGSDKLKDDSNIKDLYSGENNPAVQLGGDGVAAEFLFNERYTLQPKAWYQQKQ